MIRPTAGPVEARHAAERIRQAMAHTALLALLPADRTKRQKLAPRR
ncbi:MAG: hypothetical protein KKA73_14985 [Chloroflexi bacterium]|nr:hypothetical protein [Chloroflexota bacterium]MBU1748992.1 hypothetical protein [Chloroflexota bacterium]MBU1878414.1 hypothetical protein [Chloroflexota bacterium]